MLALAHLDIDGDRHRSKHRTACPTVRSFASCRSSNRPILTCRKLSLSRQGTTKGKIGVAARSSFPWMSGLFRVREFCFSANVDSSSKAPVGTRMIFSDRSSWRAHTPRGGLLKFDRLAGREDVVNIAGSAETIWKLQKARPAGFHGVGSRRCR